MEGSAENLLEGHSLLSQDHQIDNEVLSIVIGDTDYLKVISWSSWRLSGFNKTIIWFV